MEKKEGKKGAFIRLLDPPANYERKFSAQEMLDKLYDHIHTNEFLLDFLTSNAKRDGVWDLSEKQENILRKIAFTFDDVLKAPPKEMSKKDFDDGLGPMIDEVPF